MQAFAGYFRVNTGRVQSLQMPVISLILYCKRLTLYGPCLRCDRSLFTVDGYGVGKSQRILRLSSARPSSLTSDERPMFEIKKSCFFIRSQIILIRERPNNRIITKVGWRIANDSLPPL